MPDTDPKTNIPNPGDERRPVRLFSTLAIASSCILFACAGGCFLTILVMRPKVVESSVGANDAVAEITEWAVPPGFEGKSGMSVNNSLFRLAIAKFSHRQGRGFLCIGQLQWKFFQVPDQRAQTQDFIERFSPELKKIGIKQPETRTLVIRNLPGEFQLGSGEDLASMTQFRQVIGSFRGKLDDVILILQCEDGVLTDLEIDDFLKSIK